MAVIANTSLSQGVRGMLFGVIAGGAFESERERCAIEVAKRKVAGFILEGLYTGENADTRQKIVDVMLVGLISYKAVCE